ncbi:TBC1 domain family member 24 [Elysia marginata]|uniref:Oxidation resistance protein 1 n=1 Tax=Elysia marginata TaxID=1093978 RepID=A0AAV4GLM2_9GAST|nr:TBC1 domain family member 24 [Elysia marginata]
MKRTKFSFSTTSSRYNTGDKSAETSLLQSPQRSEGSSEDDSPFLNTSEEADNFLSPSNASDDGLGVCSKYSQLSEDGSSPSSPAASAKLTEISAAGITGENSERGVFEHALELGVAFTEYVDVDSFKASLGSKNPHTEDGFGGRSEEHLVALLQSGATKNLKSYLRNSQWPAESDARRNQWLNLCGHLVKAGGGLYQELAKDVLNQGCTYHRQLFTGGLQGFLQSGSLNSSAFHQGQQRGSRNSPVTNIGAAISRFCTSMPFEPRKLIKAGFSIRGLTRREIHKLQDKHEAYLRSLPVTEELPAVGSALSVGQTSLSHSFNGPGYLLKTNTQILTPEMLNTLWGWIPIRLTLKKLERLYFSDTDGTVLRTLYAKSQHAAHSLLVIKATDGSIFGAFCSAPWSTRLEKIGPNMSFFGTGETFIFTMYPSMKKFPWAGATGETRAQTYSDHFMAGDDDMLIIGSGNGEAIYLDNMMNRCRSAHCDTFDNEPLCESEDFSCQVVEVFGFID